MEQAREGRMHILGIINEAIPEPRADYKPHVPRIVTMTVDKDFIGAIIGKGGETIQGIQEETGATISIEEIDNKGIVEIAGTNKESIEAAVARIQQIIAVPEEGVIYTGPVKSILDFGAFVEFMPGKDGLLHISEISWDRIDNMESTGIKEGDVVTVKLIEIDKKTGKFRLSMKALQEKPEGYIERAPRNNDRRRNNNDRRNAGGDRRNNNSRRAPRNDNND